MTRNVQLGLAVLLLAAIWPLGHHVSGDGHLLIDEQLAASLALRHRQNPGTLISFWQLVSWTGGGGQRYIIVALLAGVLAKLRDWRAGVALLLASILSNALSGWMKSWFARPRPDFAPHLDSVNSLSFPSGHATSAVAVYLLFALLVPTRHRTRWVAAAIALALLTGLSRIALNVHYFTDVVAGWMLGTAFALAADALLRAHHTDELTSTQ